MIEDGKISTVPIQNATLAGGVAIGATANLVGPFGAVVVGALAGLLSTLGFVKATFEWDTCGIHNLHGMPGILGGIVSILVPFMYDGTGINPGSQALGLLCTLAIAIVSGLITGFILKAIGSPRTEFS